MVIRSMREAVSSWYIRVLLVLLVLSFVTFYGWQSVVSSGLEQGVMAVVNGEKIYERDVNMRVSSQVNQIRSNPAYAGMQDSFLDSLIPMYTRQITEAMIETQIKSEAAQDLGLKGSSKDVRELIRKQFSSADQKFNFEMYEMIVKRRMGKTPRSYEKDMAKALLSQQFDQVLRQVYVSSPLELKKSFESQNTKISISSLELNPKQLEKFVPTPKDQSEEEIKAYFQDHQDRYQEAEKRKLELISIRSTATEDDPEFFAKAEKMLNEVKTDLSQWKEKDGKTQEDLAWQYVSTPAITYGDVIDGLDELLVTDLLNASLSLDVGGISSIVTSREGDQIFLVSLKEKTSPQMPSLEKVKDQLMQDLRKDLMEQEIRAFTKQFVEDVREKKTPIKDLAKTYGLESKTTEAFVISGDGEIPEHGRNRDLTKALATASAGTYLSQAYGMDEKEYLIFVESKTLPDWKEFEEKKEELARDLEQENASVHLQVWTKHLKDQASIEYSASLNQNPNPLGL
ncbi:MAG: peptidylprolyl isomerase [Bdellovibrionales bacterium]|nr:peptidylprolyl isomerase [Bdellovibrionales bacterium]